MQQLLSKAEVAAKIGIHPESVMRFVRDGNLPKPIRLGGAGTTNRVRFVEAEIDEWIAAKMALRA